MRRDCLWLVTLASVALLFAVACGDDTDPPPDGAIDDMDMDMGVDAMQPDSTPDAAKADTAADSAAPDMVTDSAADMVADTAADSTPPDAMQPDATAAGSVVYFTGSSSSALAMNQIKLDGTGKTAVVSLPAPMDPISTSISGRRVEYAMVNRNRPTTLGHVSHYFRPMHLPGNLGHVYMYSTTSPAGRGFFVVRPTGKVDLLDFVAGSSNSLETYDSFVAMNDAGTILGAVAGWKNTAGSTLKLLRTDGKNFGTTSSGVCDITPTGAPKITFVRYLSSTFGEKHFYFITRDTASTSTFHLYRAPLDCSGKATKVPLPQVGGATPTNLDPQTHRSEDGKKIFVIAGGTIASDVVMVDDAAGTATNVSDAPANYESANMFYSHYYTRMDASPKGTHVAYTKYASGKYDLFLRPTNKSVAAVHLTAATNFASSYDSVGGVQFINEDDLFFWVGTATGLLDMFHYKISTKSLTQITKTGGTTKPYTAFAAGPRLRPYGGWISPNGKYFYTMVYEYASIATPADKAKSNIMAIDRTTGAVTYITKDMWVDFQVGNIEAAETGSKVFFYAGKGSATQDENLYVFDQNTAAAPTKLTGFTGISHIYDIMPNKDGSLVAFGQGSASSTQDMYVVEVKTTPVVSKLTTTSGHVTDMKLFTSDGKQVIYGAGTSSSKLDLRIQPVAGGAATILESTPGYTSPIMLW